MESKRTFFNTKSFAIFMTAVSVLMLAYEILFCDAFIGYIDGYYTYKYLPDFFIDGNFDYYVKFPMGTAFCEAPFFFAAHLFMKLFYPAAAVGFGGAYEYAIGFCGIFYFVLGVSFLYATLKKIYDAKIAFITCAVLVLGTPLIAYGTKYASFSHIYSFAISSVFLYLAITIDDSEH